MIWSWLDFLIVVVVIVVMLAVVVAIVLFNRNSLTVYNLHSIYRQQENKKREKIF
jgi:hypothetical protein